MRLLGFILTILLPAGSTLAQPTTTARDTLIAPEPCAFCGFGFNLDAERSPDGFLRLLVLERGRSPDGAAYVLRYESASGTFVVEDSLGSESPHGGLGNAVALARGADPPLALLSNGGDVALWRRQAAGAWALETLLAGINKPGGEHSVFGSAIAATLLPSGEELVFVGAQNGGDNPEFREGSVYAFVRAPGSDEWVREARILNPDPSGGLDEFGASVAVIPLGEVPGAHPGDVLALVGVPRNDIAAISSGAAYVLRRDGAAGTWAVEALLTSPDAGGQNVFEFGYAVALARVPEGTPGAAPGEALALIGAPSGSSFLCGASAGGAAYAFRRTPDPAEPSGYTWAAEHLFCADTPTVDHRFGSAVALAPAPEPAVPGVPRPLRALIGTDPVSGSDGHPGQAVLFRRVVDGQTEEPVWTQAAVYASGTIGTFSADWFGHAVALAGDLAFVGAYYSDAAQEQGFPEAEGAGAVFVYDAAIPTASEPERPAGLPEAGGVALSVRPNPVRGRAEVELAVAKRQSVRITLLDVLGREVAVLHDGPLGAGAHRFGLDASALAPGVYVVAASTEAGRAAQAMTVIR